MFNVAPALAVAKPETLLFKIRILRSIARAWGADEGRVKEAIQAHPNILSLKPAKLRTIGRIGIDIFGDMAPSEVRQTDVTALFNKKAVEIMGAYIHFKQNKTKPRTLTEFNRIVRLQSKRDSAEIIKDITAIPSDPVKNSYSQI